MPSLFKHSEPMFCDVLVMGGLMVTGSSSIGFLAPTDETVSWETFPNAVCP